jgi:aminoglycoside phosphotransferase (APT) family kinase protein
MPDIKQDTARPVRAGEELNVPALEVYLNLGPISDVSQFPGGYSNLTYLLTIGGREYVLRRPPVGAKAIKGGHDMGREFRVLSLLREAGYVKVPTPIAYCADEAVLGCPFYVQVEGWHKRYLAVQTDDVPAMTQLARYLTDNLPQQTTDITLLHNDFKYDNVVLNPADFTVDAIRAILDWEMCTVGDPLMDVGTSLSYWAEATDDPFRKSFNLTWLPGNLTRQEFAHRYAEQSGRDLSNIVYYYVFGLFKNAVVMQQIYGRYKQGLTRDERFAGLLAGVQALSMVGVKALEADRL